MAVVDTKAHELKQTDIHERGFKVVGSGVEMIRSNSIRRNYSIKEQLYFVSNDGPPKPERIYISQLLANKTQQDKTKIRTFVHHVIGRQKGWWFAIDELAKHLYIVADGSARGDRFRIIVHQLSFSSVEDQFGYREVNVIGDPKEVTVKQSLATFHLQPHVVRLDQSTGHLLAVCSTGGKGRKSYIPSIVQFTGDAVATLITGKDKFGDKTTAKKKLHVYNVARSCLGHTLVLFTTDLNKHSFIRSYTDKLELVLCVKIDPRELLKQSLQPTNHEYIDMFLGPFRFLGHVYKHVFFAFQTSDNHEVALLVVTIKWRKDWYTYKQLPPLPWRARGMTLKRPKENCTVTSVGFVGTDLYCVFKCEDGTGAHIHRTPSAIKNYRSCANCGTKETYKRKNKARKRIANFKVCRFCKELDIHRVQPRWDGTAKTHGCHYCSVECVKAHWNTHKCIHKREKL